MKGYNTFFLTFFGYFLFFYPLIHSSTFFHFPILGSWAGVGVYPSYHRTWGSVHIGQAANLFEGLTERDCQSFTFTFQPRADFESPINLICQQHVLTVGGTHIDTGENMQTQLKGPTRMVDLTQNQRFLPVTTEFFLPTVTKCLLMLIIGILSVFLLCLYLPIKSTLR